MFRTRCLCLLPFVLAPLLLAQQPVTPPAAAGTTANMKIGTTAQPFSAQDGAQPEAQESAAQVLAMPGQSVGAAAAPSIAYDTATLPKDAKAAWQMLVEANGLHEQGLTPFLLELHYTTYDVVGKKKADGTYAYLWTDRLHWHVVYREGGKTIWERWRTEKGIYAPPGQALRIGYPESLVVKPLFDPLQGIKEPEYFGEESVAQFDLSCFRNQPLVHGSSGSAHEQNGSPVRVCAVKGRPLLRLAQGSVVAYFNQLAAFQHRVVARQVEITEDGDHVLDLNVDTLRTPVSAELASLIPPASAVLVQDASLLLPASFPHVTPMRKVQPRYPSEMQQARIQGTVQFLAHIGADGKVVSLDLEHSPDPALTRAAEEAVKQWEWQPYLKDGVAVAFETTVAVHYTLGQR
jgi:TonB family protein